MSAASGTRPRRSGGDNNVLAHVIAVMLGLLVVVLGFFALVMWMDARDARDDAQSECYDEPSPPAADGAAPRRPPRFMLRIALASAPDLQVGDGDERCTIDLHPLEHTTDRWRDYPIHTAA